MKEDWAILAIVYSFVFAFISTGISMLTVSVLLAMGKLQ